MDPAITSAIERCFHSRRASEVRRGEMLALANREAKFSCRPANAALQPTIVPAADAQTQGRLLAAVRRYE